MQLEFSEEAKSIICGVYRHYKGNLYEVICVGKLEKTLEDVVIYGSCAQPKEVWVRTVAEFLEHVDHEGHRVQRFLLVG